MVEEKQVDINTIDDETPSSIKEGFQRWLVVAGLLITLLFVYLFSTMSSAKKEKEDSEKSKDVIPTQIQEAQSLENQNAAITRFQKEINSKSEYGKVGEKLETTSINKAFAPKKTQSFKDYQEQAEQSNKRDVTSKFSNVVKPEKTPYQDYIEKEQIRAYQSISSKDKMGSGTFYKKDKSVTATKLQGDVDSDSAKKSIAETQSELRRKIDAIAKYRQAIESGEIEPGSPPPGILILNGDEK